MVSKLSTETILKWSEYSFSHNNFFNGIIFVKKTQIPPDCFYGQLAGVSITFSTGRQLFFTGKKKY